MSEDKWDIHYDRPKSVLIYPDENLVRMLKGYLGGRAVEDAEGLRAIDLGCGTGRHLKMLGEAGIRSITGLDRSMNGLRVCKELYDFPLVQGSNTDLPFRDNAFDIAVSWGSLHYSDKDSFNGQVSEIFRVVNKGGCLLGTLRSERDTYLKRGKDLGNGTWITDLKDIESSVVSFYTEEELRYAFDMFSRFGYGLMERTVPGDMNKRISHWYFTAEK